MENVGAKDFVLTFFVDKLKKRPKNNIDNQRVINCVLFAYSKTCKKIVIFVFLL